MSSSILELPSTLGRYNLLSPLGSGGMADVFCGEVNGEAGFRTLLALKVIRPTLLNKSESEQFEEYFINEARLGGLLSHPNIVRTYDFGKVDDQFFLAMEYVDGPTLRDLTAWAKVHERPIPIGVSIQIVVEVAHALHFAHSASDRGGRPLRIVHRDLKPSNILLSRHGEVKLSDFGIAKAESNLTRTRFSGIAKGTARYMSPEQAFGDLNIDHRSDLFSLGIILYELLSGRHLYAGHSYERILRQAQDAKVRQSIADLPTIPSRGATQAILLKCLSIAPSGRYQSAQALAWELEALLETLPHVPRLRPWLTLSCEWIRSRQTEQAKQLSKTSLSSSSEDDTELLKPSPSDDRQISISKKPISGGKGEQLSWEVAKKMGDPLTGLESRPSFESADGSGIELGSPPTQWSLGLPIDTQAERTDVSLADPFSTVEVGSISEVGASFERAMFLPKELTPEESETPESGEPIQSKSLEVLVSQPGFEPVQRVFETSYQFPRRRLALIVGTVALLGLGGSFFHMGGGVPDANSETLSSSLVETSAKTSTQRSLPTNPVQTQEENATTSHSLATKAVDTPPLKNTPTPAKERQKPQIPPIFTRSEAISQAPPPPLPSTPTPTPPPPSPTPTRAGEVTNIASPTATKVPAPTSRPQTPYATLSPSPTTTVTATNQPSGTMDFIIKSRRFEAIVYVDDELRRIGETPITNHLVQPGFHQIWFQDNLSFDKIGPVRVEVLPGSHIRCQDKNRRWEISCVVIK